MFSVVYERGSRKAVIAYTAAAGGLFVLFYPATSGLPVSTWFTSTFLRWFPSTWPL